MNFDVKPNKKFDVEHFAKLKRGSGAWGAFRAQPDSPSPLLSGIDLSSEDTAGPFLWETGRERAKLEGFDFKNATFDDSDLSKVNFANADLRGASLKGCDLSDADLNGAKLSGSSWKGVKLTRTELGWESYTLEAKLKEEGEAEGTRDNEYRAKLYDAAQDGWRRLKNNWLEMGKYDDASEAAKREKRAERKAKTCQLKHKWKQKGFSEWWELIKLGWEVAVSRCYDWLCEYGENPLRVVICGLVVIVLWMVLYSWRGIEVDGSNEVWRWGFSSLSESFEGVWIFFYFSVTTFTAAGFGDFVPYGPISRLLAAGESLIGLFLSALFVWTLSRKMSPR